MPETTITHWPQRTIVFTDAAGNITRSTEAPFDTVAESVDADPSFDPLAPIYILPGQRVQDIYGQILWVREDGALFRNGVRLGHNACAKALSYGSDVFALGLTDHFWWLWSYPATWVKLSGVMDLDPSIFV